MQEEKLLMAIYKGGKQRDLLRNFEGQPKSWTVVCHFLLACLSD
jgi:hypothetical protein